MLSSTSAAHGMVATWKPDRDECDLHAPMQDLPGALDDAAVAEGLGLSSIKSRDWAIFKTSAIKGDGLFEGLDWLSNMLKTRRR